MYSPVRPMTATTGKSVLAIVAILSLVLSLFAIARPVIANHEPPDGPEWAGRAARSLSAKSGQAPAGNTYPERGVVLVRRRQVTGPTAGREPAVGAQTSFLRAR